MKWQQGVTASLGELKNPFANNRQPWTPERRALIAEAVEAGWTITRISKEFGTSHYTVKKEFPGYRNKALAVRSGSETVSRRFQESERFAQMAAMVEDGTSLNEILRTTGIHPDTVKKYFPEAGWTMEQGQERKRMEDALDDKLRKAWGYAV